MDTKQINQLMLAMGKTGTKKLVYKSEGFEIQLEREDKAPMRYLEGLNDSFEENPLRGDFEKHKSTSVVETQKHVKTKEEESKEDEMSVFVTSPMVGTIYHAPSPNDPSFVKVSDRVDKNTVVCVIEAMKVMNEVKAQVTGVVAEILVENGSPVEFGTKIFRIIPA